MTSTTNTTATTATKAKPPKKTKAKPKAKPQRVKLYNKSKANGTVGVEASVLTEDVKTWEAKGWSKTK
ncbi:MAG: hypothetical protein ABJL67_15805 [Sulfitobacter sp.]